MPGWQASRRLVLDGVREVLLVVVCGAGAWLFLNHSVLYLTGDPLPVVSRESYILTIAVLYLFVRFFLLVTGRLPGTREEVRCPDCGAPIRMRDAPDPGPPAAAPTRDPVELRTPAPARTVRRAWRPPWMADR